MIKINNINKFFNKHKSNQIHVINNISLELPEVGLVSLFGPSGSGKTTLLNVIGGLDYVDDGQITYENRAYSKNELDQYRLKNIGFVNQNYLILPNMSVEENLNFVLRPFKLTPEENAKRIHEALLSVGMWKYRRRNATNLSGGQMQRVAIARALVKSPKIIIADEPTGNLDEANTLAIMNVLSALATKCLVVLVTHEETISETYSTRIIKLSDGKITSDEENTPGVAYQKRDETKIYRWKYQSKQIEQDALHIDYFYNEATPKLELRIAFHQGAFYIEAYDEKNRLVNLVKREDSPFSDEKEKDEKVETAPTDIIFTPLEKDVVLAASFTYKDGLKTAFKTLRNYKAKQKMTLFFFAIMAFAIPFSVALGAGYVNPPRSAYIKTHSSALAYSVMSANYAQTIDKLIEIENETGIRATKEKQTSATFTLDIVDQMSHRSLTVRSYGIAPHTYLKPSQLKYKLASFNPGSNIVLNANQIIIDEYVFDSLVNQTLNIAAGLQKPTDLLGVKLKGVLPSRIAFEAEIVAIAKTRQKCIYVDQSLVEKSVFTSYHDALDSNNEVVTPFKRISNTNITQYKPISTAVATPIPAETNQKFVLVPESMEPYLTPNGNKYFYSSGPYGVEVHGTYAKTAATDPDLFITNNYAYQWYYYNYFFEDNGFNPIIFHALGQEQQVDTAVHTKFGSVGYDLKKLNLTNAALVQYRNNNSSLVSALLTIGTIIFILSMVFLYFIIRASLISRTYEIGVYRSLGVSRASVNTIFDSESALFAIVGGGITFLLSSIAVANLATSTLIAAFYYPWYLFIATGLFIILATVLVGRIAVFSILRKSPAEIIKKYDI